MSELTVWFLGLLYVMFCLGFKWSKLKKGHLLIVVKKLGSWPDLNCVLVLQED